MSCPYTGFKIKWCNETKCCKRGPGKLSSP
jgi:hypothetical protein